MSDIKAEQSSGPARSDNGEHELVAMVYRNEHNEVFYQSTEASSVSNIDGVFSGVALILVLSLVALVTIARRNTEC